MRNVLMTGLALLVAVLGLAACDDPESTKTPSFEASPQRFAFPTLSPGQGVTRVVELINVGSADLIVTDIRLVDESSAGEYELGILDGSTFGPVPDRLTIPADDVSRVGLAVRYTPTDETPDRGSVRLATNDGENLDVTIEITNGEGGPQIILSPRSLDFGQVEANDKRRLDLTISNIGSGELVIRNLGVSGSGDFSVYDGDRALSGELTPPLVIPACVADGCDNATKVLEVEYAPLSPGGDIGQLEVASNDENQAVTTIELRANGAAPCIQIVPSDTVDFGSALIVPSDDVETPNLRTVSIRSCGDVPLRVSRIEIEGGDERFRLVDGPEADANGDLLVLPAASDGVLPESNVTMGYWPLARQASGATLKVYSNASSTPTTVDIFGRGTDNACPIPIATQAEYSVQPLDTIILDGTPSTDAGGEVRRWQWTIVDRPMGSVAEPVEMFTDPSAPAAGGAPDDSSTPTALFFVDLAGHYEAELVVYDNLDQSSCPPQAVARVSIDAVPQKDLHIQLVWSTLADPDETDAFGTDVDLHLKHSLAGAAWGEAAGQYDCYYGSPNPDWGAEGVLTDDPSLDIDDTNGAGPENVNLSNPEDGVTYDIGAIYFRSESLFGQEDGDSTLQHASFVTVRVFVRGELLAEFIDGQLDAVGQLWHVASIEWCDDPVSCPRVVVHDEVLEEADYILE